MKKSKKKLLLIIPVGVLVVIFAASMALGGSKKEKSLPSVTVTDVAKHDIKETLNTSGTVESKKTMTYFSPVNAPVQDMQYKVGDSIKSGTKILTFDLTTLEQDNQKAALNLKSSQLTYDDSVEQAGKGASQVAEAKDKAGSLDGQIADKQAEVQSLTAQISDAQSQAESDAQKKDEDAKNEYQAALDAADKKTSDAQNAYDSLKTQYDVAYSKWELAEKDAAAAGDAAAQSVSNVSDDSQTADGSQAGGSQAAGGSPTVSSSDAAGESGNPSSDAAAGAAADARKKADDAEGTVKDLGSQVSEALNNLNTAKSEQTALSNTPPAQSAVSGNTAELEAQLAQAQNDLATMQSEQASADAMGDSDTSGMTDAGKEQLQTATNLSELEKKTSDELIEEGKKGIVCDFSGVISDSKIVKGATATQGTELFTLASTDDVCVNIQVSKYDFEKLKVGQKADIQIADSKYKGTVDKINKIAIPNEKGTPMIGASVHIDNPDENIFLGVEGKVTINCQEIRDVLSVPSEALNTNKDGNFCYTIQSGKLKKVTVEKGAASDKYVVITKGLRAGDVVVTDPGDCAEGDAVDAIKEHA